MDRYMEQKNRQNNNRDTFYKVGNTISAFFLPGNKTGIISRVCDEVNDNGNQIYEVIDEKGVKHKICETLFDGWDDSKKKPLSDEVFTEDLVSSIEYKYAIKNLRINKKLIERIIVSKGLLATKKSIDIEQIRQENEAEIERIIEDLNLTASEDTIIQLMNCCKLQAYMAENNDYNGDVMNEKMEYSKEFITEIDLHNALIKKSGVCTSNSLMFQSILSRLGIAVECVGLLSNSGGMHMANVVFLNGEWYFFDTTLETTIRKEHLDQELVLCCAGLGSGDYCQFYAPQCIVRREGTYEIPKNISKERIPTQIINSFRSQVSAGERSM